MNAHAGQAASIPALRRAASIFPVRDLAVSLAFYQRLGFRTASYDAGYGFARRERLRLHLRAVPELDPLANRSAAYVYTSVVDALHAEWLRCGLRVIAADSEVADEQRGQISEAVEPKPWGVREFTILDPDLNELRFGELTVAEPTHDA
jgi:catechol 2,3-dioxygenase-like lactoylglutathione lyase family enzyme